MRIVFESNRDDYSTYVFYKRYFHDISAYNRELQGIQCYAINKAYDYGIVRGSTDGYFMPLNLITRQEAALMIQKAIEYLEQKEYEAQGTELPFTDKDAISPWAKEAVEFVCLKEIMRGSNNKFDPLGHFTFEQAYLTLYTIRNQYKASE